MQKIIADTLTKKNLTIAVAESCTGGLISSELTDIPGSSKYFMFGIVAYSNDIKTEILNVAKETILKHGAVSKETALEMANNVRHLAKTNIGLGITGIAGPAGEEPLKPIGTVFISIAVGHHLYFKKFIFKGSRLKIRKSATKAALKLLYECLN
ncbi:MAG: CinA family protein [Candidatus Omnitrophota bacterium]